MPEYTIPIPAALRDLEKEMKEISADYSRRAGANAIKALDGDESARAAAKYNLGKSEAFANAGQKITDIIRRYEVGSLQVANPGGES